MLIILFSLTILLTLGYFILILLLYRGLFFLKPGKNKIQYDVSLVVAARNEEANIGNCLAALINQSYPSERYEIIIVDDRSRDKTAAIVKNYQPKFPPIRLIQVTALPHHISPKKNALAIGINAAKGEIIVTTDADCLPGPGWMQGMISYFEPEVGLVAGFSPLEKSGKNSIFSRLITLDSISLAAIAAGAIGLGKPLTCNGRNLAYRKATFQSVDGFKEIQHLISGDDDLFLHLVNRKTSWAIRYAIEPKTLVRSIAPCHFKQFVSQRIRHASKGRYYSTGLKLGLVTVYVFNLLLVMLLPISLFLFNAFLILFSCWILKSLSEFVLLYRIAKLFHYQKALIIFPVAMLLHPFYVVTFGLWGRVGKFQWKEETFKATTE